MRPRLVLLAAPVAVLVLALAACGGGSSGSTDPASVAPPEAGFLIEGTVRPEGDLKANLEALAKRVAGISDLGAKIVTELERSSLDEGRPIDFAKEVEPWLGDRGAIALTHYDGDEFTGAVGALQVTDSGEAEEFVADRSSAAGEPAKEGSYEGVTFWSDPDSGDCIGVFDDLLVLAEDEATFREAVDASNGESLADQDRFTSAMDAAPSGSLADLYVDVGGLIDQVGAGIDAEQELFFEFTGISPREATAVASLIPGADQLEIDVSTDLVGKNAPSGDASKLLESFPADSVAAVVSPEYGRVLNEGIDQLDASGIPGQVPPHQFKKALGEAGIDVEAIAKSIGDLGAFVEGSSLSDLSGAVVLETKGESEAKNTVANIGLLLRASGTAGVTAISGKVSGFSIRGTGLDRPIVLAAGGSRIVIGYGLPAAVRALAEEPARTLGDEPAYKEAVASLGDVPISGFLDGPAGLRLVSALLSPAERAELADFRPYLNKITYLALGTATSGDLATAKLIAGVR